MSETISSTPNLSGLVRSFFVHIDELVHRFKIAALAFALAAGVAWLPNSLSDPIFGYQPIMATIMQNLKAMFLPQGATLIAGGMADTVFLYAYLSVLIGALLSSPVWLYEFFAFVGPALRGNEKKNLYGYLLSFVGLFVLGTAMAYFIVIPMTFRILIYFTQSAGAEAFIFLKDFYSWTLNLFALSGVFYTIPLFIVILVHVGILPTKFLGGKNKAFLYIIMFILVWTFGPDPTPILAGVMIVPFIAVLEIATLAAKRLESKRKKRNAQKQTLSALLSLPPSIQPTPSVPQEQLTRAQQLGSRCGFCFAEVDLSTSNFCSNCHRALK
jgi:sec-independent protein translocase protein TatC